MKKAIQYTIGSSIVFLIVIAVFFVGKFFIEEEDQYRPSEGKTIETGDGNMARSTIMNNLKPVMDDALDFIYTDLAAKIADDYIREDITFVKLNPEDFNIGNNNILFREKLDSYGTSSQSLSIYDKGKLNKIIKDYRLELFKANYEDTDYYFIKTFSGGAHCCSAICPIVYNDYKLSIGQVLETNNIELPLSNDKFFVKDNDLYFYVYDDRFAYFQTDYVTSGVMYYPAFYKIDKNTGEFINRNNDFKNYYLEAAETINKQINVLIKEKAIIGEYDYSWIPWLVSGAIYETLGGIDPGLAWTKFSDNYDFIAGGVGTTSLGLSANQIKIEALEKLDIDLRTVSGLNLEDYVFQSAVSLCKNIEHTPMLNQEVEYNKENAQNPFVEYLRRALNDYLSGDYIKCDDKCEVYGLYQGKHYEDSAYSTTETDLPESYSYLKSKFIVLQTDLAPGGGASIVFMFKDQPNNLFYAWVYGNDDGYFDLRAFSDYHSELEGGTNIKDAQRIFVNQICDESAGI